MLEGAVLLDLDGTLVDTAPDLVAVLNEMLREDDRAPLPYAVARNVVSHGAIGLVRRAYGRELPQDALDRLRARFLKIYERKVSDNSRLFIDIDDLFNVETRCWGIVTNKPQALTEALLAALGIGDLPHCVVCGDQLAERKPHPAPLYRAAELLGIDAARCVYVGDAQRDIQAGKAAGMKTVVAAYGYIRPSENILAWGADAIVSRPRDLRSTLQHLCLQRHGN
jgi:2-phosphoglycolate phosphatase